MGTMWDVAVCTEGSVLAGNRGPRHLTCDFQSPEPWGMGVCGLSAGLHFGLVSRLTKMSLLGARWWRGTLEAPRFHVRAA